MRPLTTTSRTISGSLIRLKKRIVVTADGHDLSELLMGNGLARVYGTRTPLPDGHDSRTYLAHLHALENAAAVVAPLAWGQVSETTTTEDSGTITEYTPGSVIALKETSGPRTYHLGKTVTYVTRSGKTLDEDAVRTKVKVGVPVRVHYVGTGDNMMVDRVIVHED